MTASTQPPRTAHVIHSDAEAIAVAHKLAARFAIEASVRDRERRLLVAALDEFSASGLWGITASKKYGGAGVSYVAVAEVIKTISAADSSLGQIPQNHLGVLDILLQTASEEQKRYYFGKVLQGYRFGKSTKRAGLGRFLAAKPFYCPKPRLPARWNSGNGVCNRGKFTRRNRTPRVGVSRSTCSKAA